MLNLFSRKRPTVDAPSPLEEALAAWPAEARIYAIGDIHGSARLLEDLHARIDRFEAERPVRLAAEVVLGDMIDRGPASREVLDILQARSRWRAVKLLCGNHEAMLLRFLREPAVLPQWLRYGGLDTLTSYGVVPRTPLTSASMQSTAEALAAAMPAEHRALLESLDLTWRMGGFLFVHAGIRPGVPIDEQTDADLMEIREPFLAHGARHESYVVHGHTPVAAAEVLPNRANLDTGAFASGRLSCLVIDKDGASVISTADASSG